MMYNSKLVASLKSAKGKILREFGETVYVPFGEEYSIFVKNLNNVRALVSISVDGTDIGDGTKFIVDPNSSIDIERFVKEGNFNVGNRLKFIERTSAVENHRGIKAEDGLVRVEYWFERQVPVYKPTSTWIYNNPVVYGDNDWHLKRTDRYYTGDDINNRAMYSSNDILNSSVGEVRGNSTSSRSLTRSMNDAGITVEGSVSNQQFVYGGYFPVEATSHVIVLKMLGQTENARVETAVTTKIKTECKTCGRRNKNSASFCSQCGTSLQIV